MRHYSAGHRICVSASSLSGPATAGEFEIMRRYPVEGAEPMYTLRSIRGRHQRMVPGNELMRSALMTAGVETTPDRTRAGPFLAKQQTCAGYGRMPLGMAEIVRLFNEEKEARGSMRISPVTSKRHRAYELIEAKLDAAESQYTDRTGDAEARARAAYVQKLR
jgi:hypothetical protein